MLDFEILQRATGTEDADLSLNLHKQFVHVPNKQGRRRRVERTVHRVHFEGTEIIGFCLIKGEWHRYAFKTSNQRWNPAPTARTAERDTHRTRRNARR